MIDIKNQIENAKLNREAIFLKNYVDLNINWDYIIEEINISFSTKSIADMGETYVWKKENNILIRDLFYMQLISTFPTRNNQINILADEFAQIFLNKNKYESNTAQYFINLVPKNQNISNGPNSAIHCDNWDVVFVQLIGNSIWNIYKNQEDSDPIQSELIIPGDVIIVPKGVYHEIYANTPRAGISLGYLEI